MQLRSRFTLVPAVTLLLLFAAFVITTGEYLNQQAAPNSDAFPLFLVLMTLIGLVILLTIYTWLSLKNTIFKPLNATLRGAEIILNTHAAHDLEVKPGHQLGRLPEVVHLFGDEIAKTRLEVTRAMKTGAQRADNKKNYLEKVIRGLDEGVVVCDKSGRILLYNPSSLRILKTPEVFGLGKSLFNILPKGPVEHTLETLKLSTESGVNKTSTNFVCSVIGKEHMLLCRMGSLATESEEASTSGFVLTFNDVTSRQGALRERNELLRKTVEEIRSPLASLKSAAENVSEHDDISAPLRRSFYKVILDEAKNLDTQVGELADKTRKMLGGELVTADIYSSDLTRSVSSRDAVSRAFQVTQTGLPLWVRVDSHAMVVLLEFYMLHIHQLQDITEFDMDANHRDLQVYLDVIWRGEPVSQTRLLEWGQHLLTDCVGSPSVESVLKQHSSVIWSQKHPRIEGSSILRIPVPGSTRQWEHAVDDIPPRPISYDFDITELVGEDSELKNRKLRDLNFVVFDTETTGLNPDQGDEIISIAGVRVVNQRILSDEVFDQLVHPGRGIPKASIRYHGITDEDVKDAPPVDEILPQFKAFVGDSVMVAHNAWFDLKFLKRRELSSGIRFRNPVLDTLILSVCLHGHEVDQSLDAIVERLGIEIFERHTALADSLATAELLLRLIDLLEAQGIVTLQDAFDAYS